jgi:hypothetical protein
VELLRAGRPEAVRELIEAAKLRHGAAVGS